MSFIIIKKDLRTIRVLENVIVSIKKYRKTRNHHGMIVFEVKSSAFEIEGLCNPFMFAYSHYRRGRKQHIYYHPTQDVYVVLKHDFSYLEIAFNNFHVYVSNGLNRGNTDETSSPVSTTVEPHQRGIK